MADQMVCTEPLARLREIRRLVHENNRSCLPDELIVCQIYMESRFDSCAQPAGSSARGLMQLLKVANRELFRLDNLCKPTSQRCAEPALYAEADAFHASPAFIDEATNIQMGTRYLQALIDRARREKRADPIVEAYMDYRGVRNGIYYRKIRAAAERIKRDPDDFGALRAMTA
ncbi:lytic transglycosylase domain-containing protein [Massilia orientalis]|uniref:Lytic transglycosylase domain-containing protein n=1 Tax=Massilia orientalis TaxID=3050128 RepID=A0ACC7MKX3_9BURK|nr:lytic transglycosylase domain-containing protein [Massilia sp. YIM B02787]